MSCTAGHSRLASPVSLDADEEQPDDVYDRAQQIVDAGAPFKLSGWWAPSPDQRWVPVAEEASDAQGDEIEEAPARLQKPPPKEIGMLPPYALGYRDELPESHGEGLRQAAIVYLDECYSAL